MTVINYTPTHPDKVKIIFDQSSTAGAFLAKLESVAPFSKDQTISHIENYESAKAPSYLTVQTGRRKHILLNSDFQYMNHSCDPNVAIDAAKMAFIALKDVSPGDELTFFYPSTEWDMSQPFRCWCGSKHVRMDTIALEIYIQRLHLAPYLCF